MKKILTTVCVSIALGASAADVSKQVKADFADYGARPFVHYAVPPMSDVQRLPDVYPHDGVANGTVKIFAARDEYEPASFEVWGVRDLGKVKFEIGDLKLVAKAAGGEVAKVAGGEGIVFPKANLDLKIVKCWYQNLNGWFSYFGDAGEYKLCPELLLNDEDLIRTDAKTKSNYARVITADGKKREQWFNAPRAMEYKSSPFNGKDSEVFQPMAAGFDDAATFQPVALPKNEFRCFFLTAHVTRDIPAGVYRGEIKVLKNGTHGADGTHGTSTVNQQLATRNQQPDLREIYGTIPVEIRVADYTLPFPKCYKEHDRDFLCWFYQYNTAMHIQGFNGGDRKLAIHQLKAMVDDMAAHGQSIHPTWTWTSYEEFYTVDLMLKAGMYPKAFVGGPLPYGTTRAARMDVNVRVANEYDRRFGCHNVYCSWGDEPALDQHGAGAFYDQMADFFDEWHAVGMKHFIAGEECVFRKMGYGTDWFNMSTEPTVSCRQLDLWNGIPGKRAAWYANHHVGTENPCFNRRQNGLAPWLSGFTGFANYAHHLGTYCDESGFYKPMVFAYGAHHGMIDTLAWEGFREGIDDIRYATLLGDLARKAMASKDAPTQALGGKAFQYLALIDHRKADLDTCRAEIRGYIDRLLKVVKQDPVPVMKRLDPKPEAADRAFAAEIEPLRAQLAKAKPNERGGILAKMDKVYRRFFRWEELADFLEKEGSLAGASKAASDSFQFDRAQRINEKLMFDKNLYISHRTAYAWRCAFENPALWNDPKVVELLETVVEYKTNDYCAAWHTYGRLCDPGYYAERYRTPWRNGYRTVAKIADRAGVKGMGGAAATHGIRLFYDIGDFKTVNEIIDRYLGAKGVKPDSRYTFGLYRALFGAGGKKSADFARGVIAKYEKENLTKDIPTDKRIAAINAAGSLALSVCENDVARGLEAYRAALYKPVVRRQYAVRFSEKPIEGTDWTGIGAEVQLCDRKYGGSTELMYTDVTTGARAVSDGKTEAEPMRLQIAADAWGVHFRFESTDPKAREMLARRAGSGSFEGYLAPGKNKPYTCFFKDDNAPKWGMFATCYDAIGQQRIDEDDASRVRTQTVVRGDKIASVLSLSWDNFVENVPADGSVWDFEVFRWGRDDCAWNGSRSIHERSTWGELVFKLSPAERTKILRGVEEQAYWRFRCETYGRGGLDRYEGHARHWYDRNVGDPAFYEARVKPWMANLFEAGKVLGENPSDETINRLEKNGTLSQWHNVFQVVDRMRREWLEK